MQISALLISLNGDGLVHNVRLVDLAFGRLVLIDQDPWAYQGFVCQELVVQSVSHMAAHLRVGSHDSLDGSEMVSFLLEDPYCFDCSIRRRGLCLENLSCPKC